MSKREVPRPAGEEATAPEPLRTSGTRPWVALLGGLVVAVLLGVLTVPNALGAWWLSPDAIVHVAIANAWVHGSGFVDPVKYHWYLAAGVPFPAFASRGPVVPALIALPLKLGASISETAAIHAVWASLIAGAMVPVAARFMRLPAAIGAALLFGLSPAWRFVSHTLWTEATAWGSCLLVLVTSRGVVRDVRGGLLCGAATVLAMLTRANLGILAVAVIFAAIQEMGPSKALRSRSFWSYIMACVLIYKGAGLWIEYSTGQVLYSAYAAITENINNADLDYYQKVYMGTWYYIELHAREIFKVMGTRLGDLYDALCIDPLYNYVGWLMVPAALYALLSTGPGSLERRITALSALAFSAVVVANYSGYEAVRYPLLGAGSAALCGLAMLDSLSYRLERRLPASRSQWFAPFLRITPLLLVLFLVSSLGAGKAVTTSLDTLRRWKQFGTSEAIAVSVFQPPDADVRTLCRHMDEDAVVSAYMPWSYLAWCGNAGVLLPVDIANPEWQKKFIEENQPRYFVWDGNQNSSWLSYSPLVHEIARSGRLILYEVTRSMRRENPWVAPPPIACAGKDPDCARALRRG